MTRVLMVLGAGPQQIPLISTAKALGLQVVAADPSAAAPGLALADQIAIVDLADPTCVDIARHHAIHGVLTAAADYPLPMVARICDELGLAGPSPISGELATNKWLMRQAFDKAGVPSPRSVHVMNVSEAVSAARRLGGQTIVKPDLCHGGRGVSRLEADASEGEISDAFTHAHHETRGLGVLVEDFIDGPEFSVEAISHRGRMEVVAVTDKLTSGPPHYVEIGHSQPSQYDETALSALKSTAIAAVSALGITDGATHTELRMGQLGPVVMEVGARMGGGYITTHLVPLSTGVDMVAAAIAVALGDSPDLSHSRSRGAAIRSLTAAPGRVTHVSGEDLARASDGCRIVQVDVHPGDRVIPLRDSRGRLGHVICEAADAQAAVQLADRARECISIRTEMADNASDDRT